MLFNRRVVLRPVYIVEVWPHLFAIWLMSVLLPPFTACQHIINDIWLCKYGDWNMSCFLLCVTKILAAFTIKRAPGTVISQF